MAYTALEAMRLDNLERFGEDLGPMQPPFPNCEGDGLKGAALRFVREECERLRFDRKKERLEQKNGVLLGKSLRFGQIPYNMQMDIDRLCLERALGAFLDAGAEEDACLVCYCFMEMFMGRRGHGRELAEFLSSYASGGRERCARAVWTFAQGLAVYETDPAFRRAFKVFYGFDADEDKRFQRRCAANRFLERWGLTALLGVAGGAERDPLTGLLNRCGELRPEKRETKSDCLSKCSFLHLYDFAVALHGRTCPEDMSLRTLESRFEVLSLAYRLSTLRRARNFGRYLEAISCFYSDRPEAHEAVTEFTPEQAAIFAPMEHERWVREHWEMGWTQGDDYRHLPVRAALRDRKQARLALRDRLRMHVHAMEGELSTQRIYEHYLALPEAEQDKDWKPFNSMLRLLEKFDGVRIYKM